MRRVYVYTLQLSDHPAGWVVGMTFHTADNLPLPLGHRVAEWTDNTGYRCLYYCPLDAEQHYEAGLAWSKQIITSEK